MRLQDYYSIVVTEQLMACRDFYRDRFGLEVVLEANWFVQLSNGERAGRARRSCTPTTRQRRRSRRRSTGRGCAWSFLKFQVADAAADDERFTRKGAKITGALRDEPFGRRRAGLFDPAGVWIDVVEQIAPEFGWWNRYMVSDGE